MRLLFWKTIPRNVTRGKRIIRERSSQEKGMIFGKKMDFILFGGKKTKMDLSFGKKLVLIKGFFL